MREQSPLRVLIADDHEMVRRGLSLVLETEKDFCVVGEASTGRQAVEAVLQQRPDVLDPVPGYGVLCGPSFGSAHSVPRSELL
jgi:CheY-like chemotaxis protein